LALGNACWHYDVTSYFFIYVVLICAELLISVCWCGSKCRQKCDSFTIFISNGGIFGIYIWYWERQV